MTTKTQSKLQPLGDRVIVKASDPETVTKGGIILPGNAQQKPMQGEVIAVGSGRILESGAKVPMEVKPGMQVLYGKYAGAEVKIEGEEYTILKETEILTIIKD